MMPEPDHITVCICTYQRPDLLGQLLSKLKHQATENRFDYSIVIVDNDREQSAKRMVAQMAREMSCSIRYEVEPEQNIALARNRAVANASGKFVALIDDDEVPGERWLLSLHQTFDRYPADGVLGPVLPLFAGHPPAWVLKARLFDRPTHPTGQILTWRNTRTGNALLRRTVFEGSQIWFNPAFGSGGEDRDFFRRAIEKGHVFVWCNEAAVHETVAPARWRRSVLLKRALLRGKMAHNRGEPGGRGIMASVVAVLVYSAGLPLFLVLGQHVFMQYLIKGCDHLGKILAFLGIDPVKKKYITG